MSHNTIKYESEADTILPIIALAITDEEKEPRLKEVTNLFIHQIL